MPANRLLSSSALRAVLLAAPVLLAACADYAMPTGYTYENQLYKAPPGREASKPAHIIRSTDGMHNMGSESTTIDQATASSTMTTTGPDGDVVNPAFNGPAEDLIRRLLRDLGKPMEPVWVNQSSPMAGSLKLSLRNHGVPVARQPGDGPFVLVNTVDGTHASITLFSNHASVTSESGASSMMAPGDMGASSHDMAPAPLSASAHDDMTPPAPPTLPPVPAPVTLAPMDAPPPTLATPAATTTTTTTTTTEVPASGVSTPVPEAAPTSSQGPVPADLTVPPPMATTRP